MHGKRKELLSELTDINVPIVYSVPCQSQGGWEVDIVRNVVRVLNKYLDAVLLGGFFLSLLALCWLGALCKPFSSDIGCNIGMYTVVAAGMQRQVRFHWL